MKYSYFILQPHDKDESKRFMEFRLKDVMEQCKLFCYLLVYLLVVQIVRCLLQPDIISVVDTVFVFVISLSKILFYLLGRRLSWKHVQTGFVVLLGLGNAMLIPVYVLAIAPSEASETDKKLFLEYKIQMVISICGYWIMFMCSSLRYYFLVIIPCAMVLAGMTWLQQEEKFFADLIQQQGYFGSYFLIWYLLQNRELKSFIRERQGQSKQDQLTNVFNSQSDAVIAYKNEGSQQVEQQSQENRPSQVLFSNTKSTQLFGCDLTTDQDQQTKLGQKRFRAHALIESKTQDQQHGSLIDQLASQNQSEKRAESDSNRPTHLESLEDILKKEVKTIDEAAKQDGETRVEVYEMIAQHELPLDNKSKNEEEKDLNQAKSSSKTIIVNRIPMTFDEQECLLVNFTDISAYVNLQEQQESYKLLKTLNTQVHHEMLVPLKVNTEMAQMLLDNPNATDEQRDLAGNILVASNLVMLHAHDFLDQSLIEKGVFVPQYSVVSPKEVILSTVKIVELSLKQRQLEIITEIKGMKNLKLKLDQRRLQQVLLNLLNNALKFRSTGEIKVQAQIRTPPEDNNKRLLQVKVRDSGIGMSEAQLKDVFTPFSRSARRSDYGGNGVGLSICKAICTSLNGDIHAESILGVGTTVIFSHECFTVVEAGRKRAKVKSKALHVIEERTFEDSESQFGVRSPKVQDKTSDVNQMSPVGRQTNFSSQEVAVSFQGHEILVDLSKSIPIQLQTDREQTSSNQINRLLQHLNYNSRAYLPQNKGKIVIVDNQFVSQQSVQLKIRDLGITNEFKYLKNGQEAVEFINETLNEVRTYPSRSLTPITLILMDINMPIMTGVEAMKLIKQSYEEMNEHLAQQERPQLARPALLYYSQYNRKNMEQFIANDEQADYYLEKPVPTQEIKALFKLLNIIGHETQD